MTQQAWSDCVSRLALLTQVGAEAGHEVSGGDHVHGGVERLQDQLEAPADLLLTDLTHRADLLQT